MGLQDIIGFTVRKVKPNGTAGVIKCASFVIALVFVIVAFSVAVFSHEDIAQNRLVTSLVPDGMKQSPPVVPYPQITFCPFFEHGVITGIMCRESSRGDQANMTRTLVPKVVPSMWTSAKYPNNVCQAFNTDGKQFPTWDLTLFCGINSTSTDGNTTWPGRVRVYIDKPGTTNFSTLCVDCFDGIDGTLAISGYFTAGFWQGTLVDVNGAPVADYRTQTQRFPIEARAGRVIYDDMMYVGGFFTPMVWKYQDPTDFRAAIGGEQFGEFTALIGGLGIVAWGIYACLSTTFVLLVVGADGLSSEEKRTPF